MRILNLTLNLCKGGAERQLSYLAPELVRRNHDVHIAYLQEGHLQPELPGVTLHKLAAHSNYDPRLLWHLNKLIRRLEPDIIQTWIVQMDVLGGIAAQISKTPWLFREPSSVKGYLPTWKIRLRTWVAVGASAIISNSRGGEDYWNKLLPASRRYIVPNGLPLHEISSAAPVLLPPILVTEDTPIVLYVGRLAADISANKNLTLFMEALARVRKIHDVIGVICGDGPQRSELEVLSRRLGLEKHVLFTGYLPAASVWALMKKAAVFVSLSAYEGCPNTVMEAMACGCPLVISDIPAHREILDNESAFFVDPMDTQQTADSILWTLNSSQEVEKLVMNAQQKAQKWSISEMARNYENVYQELL